MAVDKNLFMYDLAIAAIMKTEGPYIKEWIDYHLLAGVDHFYIYDNESPDNMREVLQPYIDAGIVTYIFHPGKIRQYSAYNDATLNYRFQSRYIATIDGDEFIFPRNNKNIVEVVDEILSNNPSAVALSIHWNMFGSNYQDNADYSRGVIERFTRRYRNDHAPIDEKNGLPGGNGFVKTISNPRYVSYVNDAHNMRYFEGRYSVDEAGNFFPISVGLPVVTDKIVVNHYVVKSREEYAIKSNRGAAHLLGTIHHAKNFKHDEQANEIVDDSIIKYRDYKLSENNLDSGEILEKFAPLKQPDYNKIFNALIQNLLPVFSANINQEFFMGKIETFLTCLALGSSLKNIVLNEKTGNFIEETALEGILKTLSVGGADIADMRLLFSELPRILILPYPAVKNICSACINIIPQIMDVFRLNAMWKEYTEVEYIMRMLKAFERS